MTYLDALERAQARDTKTRQREDQAWQDTQQKFGLLAAGLQPMHTPPQAIFNPGWAAFYEALDPNQTGNVKLTQVAGGGAQLPASRGLEALRPRRRR